MKKQEQIRYKDVIDLGFIATTHNDIMFEETNGYPYTLVQLKVNRKLYFDWDMETRLCSLVRHDKNSYIKNSIPMLDLEHLKQMVDFFKKDVDFSKKEKTNNNLTYTFDITTAC